jgi:hypothetical protein
MDSFGVKHMHKNLIMIDRKYATSLKSIYSTVHRKCKIANFCRNSSKFHLVQVFPSISWSMCSANNPFTVLSTENARLQTSAEISQNSTLFRCSPVFFGACVLQASL